MLLTVRKPINLSLSMERNIEVENKQENNFVLTIDISKPVKVINTIITVAALSIGAVNLDKYSDIL